MYILLTYPLTALCKQDLCFVAKVIYVKYYFKNHRNSVGNLLEAVSGEDCWIRHRLNNINHSTYGSAVISERANGHSQLLQCSRRKYRSRTKSACVCIAELFVNMPCVYFILTIVTASSVGVYTYLFSIVICWHSSKKAFPASPFVTSSVYFIFLQKWCNRLQSPIY